MKIQIIKSDDNCWYKGLEGNEFVVQSESKKGGKGKYVVRIPKELRHLMNGYIYGWVDKEDCIKMLNGVDKSDIGYMSGIKLL